MPIQLVPPDLLQQSTKILFIAHLALGDFTYLQNCFRAFTKRYPHIQIHLWIDELRRTDDQTQWEHLKKYVLYDWVNASNLFAKTYTRTYNSTLLQESIREAQSHSYPIVVSLAVLHRHEYASLARKISPKGFVVGQKKVAFYDLPKHWIYKKLDAFIPAYRISRKQRCGADKIMHISGIYAGWFSQLFGLSISEQERFPFVDIPERWHDYAQQQFQRWGFNLNPKTVFLNGFSKSVHRSWSLERIFNLATEMRKNPNWNDANFIVNVVPERMQEAQLLFSEAQLDYIQLFSAEENFFQLPAILNLCQLIISVETAVMHLANAVHVPVIALMRQTSPEWVPIDANLTQIITVQRPKAWVDEITVEQVMAALPPLPATSLPL